MRHPLDFSVGKNSFVINPSSQSNGPVEPHVLRRAISAGQEDALSSKVACGCGVPWRTRREPRVHDGPRITPITKKPLKFDNNSAVHPRFLSMTSVGKTRTNVFEASVKCLSQLERNAIPSSRIQAAVVTLGAICRFSECEIQTRAGLDLCAGAKLGGLSSILDMKGRLICMETSSLCHLRDRTGHALVLSLARNSGVIFHPFREITYGARASPELSNVHPIRGVSAPACQRCVVVHRGLRSIVWIVAYAGGLSFHIDLRTVIQQHTDLGYSGSRGEVWEQNKIIMANPLPPGHNADFLEVEPIQPKPAQDMPDLNEVLSYVEEDPEEEPELAPAAPANMNGWIEWDVLLDNLREVPVENPEDDEEEEMDVDKDEEMDDPEIIHPYEEMDPVYRPPPDSDSEPEEAVAPVGSSSTDFSSNQRKVFTPGLLGKNVDALYYKVKSLAQQIKDRAEAEFITLKRLNNGDRCINSFDDDFSGLDSVLREEIQSRGKIEQLVPELGKQVQEMKESDVRAENKKLKKILMTTEESDEYHHKSTEYYHNNLARVSWHHHHLRHWSFEVQGLLPPHMHYRETPYVAPAIPVVPVTHDDPNDSYVAARNAIIVPAIDDDGSATLGDTQSSKLRGSPRNVQ
ncbi:hypothetical protein Tco_1098056 [Tanacetum coccineum]